MAENKRGFILYADLIHVVRKLSDDKSGVLFKTILEYVNDENPAVDDPIIDIAFEPVKQSLKRDLQKYESKCQRNRDNGSKGGRPKEDNPKKPKKPSGLFRNPKNPVGGDNDNDNDIDNDKDNDNKEIVLNKRKESFVNFVSLHQNVYPENIITAFCDYWTEKNKSGTKMRFELEKTFEIPLRLRTWASRDRGFVKPAGENITYKEMIRRYNEGETDIQEKYEPVNPGSKSTLWKPKNSLKL
jgi:hypothetical protein